MGNAPLGTPALIRAVPRGRERAARTAPPAFPTFEAGLSSFGASGGFEAKLREMYTWLTVDTWYSGGGFGDFVGKLWKYKICCRCWIRGIQIGGGK